MIQKINLHSALTLLILSGIISPSHNTLPVSLDASRDITTVEWTGATFEWPCGATKSIFFSSGKYITKNIIATRAQIYKDDAILALPRYKQGVPATLAKVSLKSKGCQAILTPWPCWTTQEEGNCQALQSVVDIFLDAQDVVWALDVGVVDTLGQPKRTCPPKIVAYSAKSGKQLKTLDLTGLVAKASRLQYIVTEYSADGRPFVYVSDAATRAILVFDVAGNKGYRVVLPSAILPANGKRDVLYLALVRKGCSSNYIYFTYLSSSRVFFIKTEFLQQGSATGRIVDAGPKTNKIVIIGTDGGSAIFFRYEGCNEIYRWDTNRCFKEENYLVVYKDDPCLLATHAFPDVKRNRMRILKSNFPDFIQNTVGCGAVQQISVLQGQC